MAVVALPSSPGPRAVSWRPMDFGGTVQGALGGTAQRVNRLGNRWVMEVTMPAMTPADAQAWSAALTSGLRNGVSMAVRQVGFDPGSPGTVLVAGGSQSGASLDCDGFAASYGVTAGQFLSITTGSRKYLYLASAAVTANGSGEATLSLEPPLRAEPADNDPVELAAPVIEGLLAGVPAWSLDPNRLCNGFTFAIEEVA